MRALKALLSGVSHSNACRLYHA